MKAREINDTKILYKLTIIPHTKKLFMMDYRNITSYLEK